MPKVETSEIESENSVKKSVFTEIKEGILYLKNQNGLIPLLLSFAMVNATLVPTGGYLVLLIENFHLGTSQDYAYVLTASNIGILLASLIFTRIKIDNVIRGLVVGIIIIFAGPIIIGFTPKGEFGLIMIANFITGFAVIVASISSSTLWQKTVPFEFQGRVNSLRMTFATMAQPLGMILGGFIADSLGLPEMYLIFGVLGLIIFLLFVIFSNIRFIGKDEQQTVNKISQDQIFAQNTAS